MTDGAQVVQELRTHSPNHGQPLERAVRVPLEARFGCDLSRVRIHDYTGAHLAARELEADAFATGADVYFAAGRFDPHTAAGLQLLAHELAHLLQQGRDDGTTRLSAARKSALECEADVVAAAVVRGDSVPTLGTVRPSAPGDELGVQFHSSWEHRLLGDAPPADLNRIATSPKDDATRHELLLGLRKFYAMWMTDPDAVTEDMITAYGLRALHLGGSNLLVTYGELNTLPDYMASPIVLEQQGRDIMLPILQAVRQEGYNKVSSLLGLPTASFAEAVATPWGADMFDLIWETKKLDWLTAGLGVNHYEGLVARNACHFAPYSWYRWEQFYLMARQDALNAFQSATPADRARFTQQAWMDHGYADHFLQDSFAAGHLVNKTLIMQWWVDWASQERFLPVADWATIQTMTVARQPGLAALGLYDGSGAVRDPQTAEEQATEQARMDMAGVQADGGITQATAYQAYLTFLTSTVAQSASGVLHDAFNQTSLDVTSVASPQPFQIYGDDTMLNGGAGVEIAATTAQMSQQSILDILNAGVSAITTQQLRDRFPTGVSIGGNQFTLRAWHEHALRDTANELFDSAKSWMRYATLRAFPHIDRVSVDQPQQLLAPRSFGASRHAPRTARLG